MSARTCPECGGLVASTLIHCPHCGFHMGIAEHNTRAARGSNPYNSLVYLVIAIIIFWPLGLMSLYYHVKSDDKWSAGDAASAELYGRNARRFAKIAIYIALILLFIYLLLFIAILSF